MKKKLLTVLAIVLVLWLTMFATDFLQVSHFREPIFVLRPVTADDGGSYTGQVWATRWWWISTSPPTALRHW